MEKLFDFLTGCRDDSVCFVTPRGRVKYGELNTMVRSLCGITASAGLAVLAFAQNAYCVAFYVSCLLTHTPLLLLEPSSGREELLSAAERFGADLAACGGLLSDACVFRAENFCVCRLPCGGDPPPDREIALLVSTSGSLHNAKFVKLSAENIRCNTRQILDYLPVGENDLAFPPPPFSYVYGLSVLNTHLSAGAAVALCGENILSKAFWDFAENIPATNINGVPYFYDVMRRLGGFSRLRRAPRFLTQAGGRIGEASLDYILHALPESDLYIMYGQSEATARMSYLPPECLRAKRGSVGIAVSGGAFRIENGEILYRGKNIFRGYAQNRSDLAGTETFAELHTGDCGYLDPDGFLYITGRKSRFAKIAGKRISLDACEGVLSEAGIAAAVLANGDGLKIFAEEDLDRNCAAELLKVPAVALEIIRLGCLPRSANGKIQYGKLEQA